MCIPSDWRTAATHQKIEVHTLVGLQDMVHIQTAVTPVGHRLGWGPGCPAAGQLFVRDI